MTTTLDMVETTRSHLGATETLNQCDAMTAAATSITLQRELRNINPGTLLSIGLETIYVWAVTNAATRTLEVRRGHGGSTAAAHSAGDLVRVAPPHTDFAIFRALNEEIMALSGIGLFNAKTLDLTSSADSARTYNLAADVVDVLDVRYDADTFANEWPRVRSWTPLPNMPTSEFASGNALRIDSALPAGRTIRVTYRAALAKLATLSDDVATVAGLRESAHDIPPLGAAWRLTAPGEIERNQTRVQGDARRAEEVPPGAKLRSALSVVGVRQQRIHEELLNQARDYPSRRR